MNPDCSGLCEVLGGRVQLSCAYGNEAGMRPCSIAFQYLYGLDTGHSCSNLSNNNSGGKGRETLDGREVRSNEGQSQLGPP